MLKRIFVRRGWGQNVKNLRFHHSERVQRVSSHVTKIGQIARQSDLKSLSYTKLNLNRTRLALDSIHTLNGIGLPLAELGIEEQGIARLGIEGRGHVGIQAEGETLGLVLLPRVLLLATLALLLLLGDLQGEQLAALELGHPRDRHEIRPLVQATLVLGTAVGRLEVRRVAASAAVQPLFRIAPGIPVGSVSVECAYACC